MRIKIHVLCSTWEPCSGYVCIYVLYVWLCTVLQIVTKYSGSLTWSWYVANQRSILYYDYSKNCSHIISSSIRKDKKRTFSLLFVIATTAVYNTNSFLPHYHNAIESTKTCVRPPSLYTKDGMCASRTDPIALHIIPSYLAWEAQVLYRL